MKDIIEVQSEVVGVSNQDVEAVSKHLATIRKFVKEQLKEGINGDYAVIPGTYKDSLLKPGAEKLLKLFGLSTSVECIHRQISPEENLAMFTYKAKVFHIRTGNMIAECEGVANNLEKKYRETKAGKTINCMDILNTLMKMAQKRAIVGATILATAASDYFTQDEDEVGAQKREKQTEDGSRFNSNQNQGSAGDYIVPFGKHNGKALKAFDVKELTSYCEWLKNNNDDPKGKMKELLDKAREFLRAS